VKKTPASYTIKTISEAAASWREEGLQIVFTNGCFDVIHPGHTHYLRDARQLGDLLVVGINSDQSVTDLKGAGRPILTEDERTEVLLSLRSVDAVVPFSEPTPIDLIKAVKPHVLAKGGDWPVDKIVGREFVEKHGGTVVSLPFQKGISTSELISRIQKTSI
jgi:D-beta-D-heptose 7-phosphate kinase/D-beta-D-heptose 1-phosphate adenosyltransferase